MHSCVLIALCCVLFVHTAATSSAALAANGGLRVPLQVRIVLLGFSDEDHKGQAHDRTKSHIEDEDVQLDAHILRQLLDGMLRKRRPRALHGGATFPVEYKLKYHVERLDQIEFVEEQIVRGIEQQREKRALARAAALRNDGGDAAAAAAAAEDDDELLDTLDMSHFEEFLAAFDNQKHTVVVLRPRKRVICEKLRIPMNVCHGGWRYGYDAGVAGSHTQAWITSSMWVVVDLSAGPFASGPAAAGSVSLSRTVSDSSLPRVEHYASNPLDLHAQIARLVVSAVEHVLVPDVQFDAKSAHYYNADKILAPIIVFRDHELFDPLATAPLDAKRSDSDGGDEHVFGINVSALRRRVQDLVLADQSVEVLSNLHQLHDHPHILGALHRSIHHKSVKSLQKDGRYTDNDHILLNGQMLLRELANTVDVLTMGVFKSDLMQENEELAERMRDEFFNSHVPHELLGTRANGGSSAADTASGQSQGTRIVPIYVFSLCHFAPNLQMDSDEPLVAFTANAAVVLQTNQSALQVPFYAAHRLLRVDARRATRHTLAALAYTLAGLVPPTLRYSRSHGDVVFDATWSSGKHPFGVFSAATVLSDALVRVAVRNHLLGRLAAALARIEHTLDDVDEFAAEFVLDPFGERLATLNSAKRAARRGGRKDTDGDDDEAKRARAAAAAMHAAPKSMLQQVKQSLLSLVGLGSPTSTAAAARDAADGNGDEQRAPSVSEFAANALLLAHPVVAMSLHYVDSFYIDAPATAEASLTHDLVDRLKTQVLDIRSQMENISELIAVGDNEAASHATTAFLKQAERFRTYAASELEEARIRLQCCEQDHSIVFEEYDIVHTASSDVGATNRLANVLQRRMSALGAWLPLALTLAALLYCLWKAL